MVEWGRKLPGPSDHEGHFLGGDILRGDDEVAFVFTISGVEDHDELSSSCVRGMCESHATCVIMYCRYGRD